MDFLKQLYLLSANITMVSIHTLSNGSGWMFKGELSIQELPCTIKTMLHSQQQNGPFNVSDTSHAAADLMLL